MRCDACRRARASVRGFGMNLCEECFIRIYRRRVFHVIKAHNLVERGDRIAVALSGGKDSIVALKMLKEYGADVFAYHINLGIPGYSEEMESISREFAAQLRVEIHVTSLQEEFGFRVVDIKGRKACSACGTVKRYLMNRIPRELGATKVATGHNMDDILEFFLKNLLSGNYAWNRKLVPHNPSEHPLVLPRIRPLFEVGERETLSYALLTDLPVRAGRCPLAKFSGWKEIIYEIDRKKKNFRVQLIRSVRELAAHMPGEDIVWMECAVCGEPTSREVCAFCSLRARASAHN